MILRMDPSSPVPPYEQIRGQMTKMIKMGVLPAGTRLPAIRQLAADLGLAGGTVARAYRELEQVGFIVTRGRKGTFVLDAAVPHPDEGEHRLNEAARTFALEAAQLGAAPGEALSAARSALAELGPA